MSKIKGILDSWSEGPGGMLCSADPDFGGIIDRTFRGDEWVVIFNNDNLETLKGFATRIEAVQAAMKVLSTVKATS
jgi:hypothetical protein